MEYAKISHPDVPGLNQPLGAQDLENSHYIYNKLPEDSQQPTILEKHTESLAKLFVRNRAHGILGIHLAHAHFLIPENTVLLGVNYEEPHCRWARTAAIPTVDLSNVHGHIFVLTDHKFQPYEYQKGPAPDLSQIDTAFFPEFANYLNTNNLSTMIGLQVIDQSPASMLELVLPLGTIMLDASYLKGCVPTTRTGWRFEARNGEPRVCQTNETHGQTATTHEIYNKGDAHPKLKTIDDLKRALEDRGIL